MCGIAGVSLKTGSIHTSFLEQMNIAQAHRGPNGSGTFSHKGVGLAHVRLSIIDLKGGAQPFSHQGVHLVANGEVYNYKTLQAALKKEGVRFQSGSDSEPILYLYQKFGFRFPQHLRGMFGVAIYNEETEELLLARDPFGIKPLYYAETSKGVAFASEPAVLTKVGWVKPQANPKAWGNYFNRHYVAGQLTLFKGIKRVLPGEVLVIKHGKITSRHCFPPQFSAPAAFNKVDALAKFDELFEESINLHLQADVPYAAYLSGGVDSSSMVTKMADVAKNVHTFTIGFKSNHVADERQNANALAKSLKTTHKSIEFGEEDFWKYLPTMAVHMDDLTCDYAALPVLKLSEAASKHVTVVLAGEGGDEILAGYKRYHPPRWKFWRKGFRRGGDASHFPQIFKHNIAMWRENKLPHHPHFSAVQNKQYADMQDWLPCDLLTKLDRCTMAYGLEGRVPFLDGPLATYCFSLPDYLKIKDNHPKYLLKTWLSEVQKTLDPWERKKGFTVPIKEWLENKRPQLAEKLVGHPALEEIVNQPQFAKLFNKPFSKKAAQNVFNILCYCLWFEAHINQKTPTLDF